MVAWKETILAAEELNVQRGRAHTLTTSRKRSEKAALDVAMEPFHPAVRDWFTSVFHTPTRAQELGWPAIARGDWTLIFAPTGSGKTLTAFLWALDRLMFAERPAKDRRCRVVYISPLKALAVDVERNLRAPLTGIANLASERGEPYVLPSISIRTGDTPQSERARFLRDPADILITTPESIYLMLTSNVRDVLRGVETIIVDEVHALVPNKRGAHLALSLERLSRLAEKTPQRIGLSATQNPLEEVAKYLGGLGPGSAVRGRRRQETSRETARPRDRATPSSHHHRHRREKKQLSFTSKSPSRRWPSSMSLRATTSRAVRPDRGPRLDLACHPSAAAGADPRAPLDADLRQLAPSG